MEFGAAWAIKSGRTKTFISVLFNMFFCKGAIDAGETGLPARYIRIFPKIIS